MSPFIAALKTGVACAVRPSLAALVRLQQVFMLGVLFLIQYPGKKGDVYNILWVLVFGFATLNILGLAARRYEAERSRMSFGEFLAVMVVLISVGMLAFELLHMFHIFPLKLQPR